MGHLIKYLFLFMFMVSKLLFSQSISRSHIGTIAQNSNTTFGTLIHGNSLHLSRGQKIHLLDQFCFLGSENSPNALTVIKITPNPSTGLIRITSNDQIILITVYDYLMREVLSSVDETINLDFLTNGAYTVRVTTENNVSKSAIIIIQK